MKIGQLGFQKENKTCFTFLIRSFDDCKNDVKTILPGLFGEYLGNDESIVNVGSKIEEIK